MAEHLVDKWRSPSDDEAARHVVSQHYANRVATAQAELERITGRLREQVKAAEAAQQAWEHHGEITCASVCRDPHQPELVASERAGIQLTADRPATEAWKAAIAAPDERRLRTEYARAKANAWAVERWLTTTESTTSNPQETDTDGM